MLNSAVRTSPAVSQRCQFGLEVTHLTIFQGPSGGSGGVNIASGLGALWYGDAALNAIVKMTTTGETKTYKLPADDKDAAPEGITYNRGDNRMWFTEWNKAKIGALNKGGYFQIYDIAQLHGNPSESVGMVEGPDLRSWFTTASYGIGASGNTGDITLYSTGYDYDDPIGIGVDHLHNKLWYVTFGGPYIGRMDTHGGVINFDVNAAGGFGIVLGPDQRMWFPDPSNTRLGAINTDGTDLKYYKDELTAQPFNVVTAPDGNLYFTTGPGGVIGQVQFPADAIYECTIKSSVPFDAIGITIGPDKNVWLLDNQHSQVARLTLPTRRAK